MTTTSIRHEKAVNSIVSAFCRGFTPITPLERLETALECALLVVKDTSRTEAGRMRELKTRVSLMLSCAD